MKKLLDKVKDYNSVSGTSTYDDLIIMTIKAVRSRLVGYGGDLTEYTDDATEITDNKFPTESDRITKLIMREAKLDLVGEELNSNTSNHLYAMNEDDYLHFRLQYDNLGEYDEENTL